MNDQRRTYRFGPLERRGLVGPMRTGQALTIVGSVGVAVIVLDVIPSAAGLLIGILLIGLSFGLTTFPIGGRSCEEWAPVAAAYLTRLAIGATRFRSSLPAAGQSRSGRGLQGKARPANGRGRGGAASTPSRTIEPVLPGTLRHIRLARVESDGRTLGAISENRGHRLTSVLVCRSVSFALLDPEAQERRLSQWGLLLASLATTPVRRLQWIERTAPARGDELARWLHEARDPDLPPRGAPIVESYLELIGHSARVTQDHEVLLTLQVDAGRGNDLPRTLTDETERIARALDAAEIKVVGVLGAGQIARVLRTAYDPYSRSELAAMDAVTGRRGSLLQHEAGPLGAQERWDHYRCDGACHATFWIGGWPRVDVSPMFMDALLGSSATVRTVSVTFEALSPERSTREVEAAITRDRADSELRRRFGQSETARHRQAQESAARREAELAAGHGEVRLSGFVTVSGRDEAELERACAEVHQQAARARIELHRMYGQQAEGFTFTLPLGRGLR